MSVIKSTTVVSDVTGEVLEDPYRVGIFFDNVMFYVDLDRNNLVAELEQLSLLQALWVNNKVKGVRYRGLPGNTKASLRQMLHHQARKWAEEQGLEVGRRGVVSKEIIEQYREANGVAPLDELLDHLEEDKPEDIEELAEWEAEQAEQLPAVRAG